MSLKVHSVIGHVLHLKFAKWRGFWENFLNIRAVEAQNSFGYQNCLKFVNLMIKCLGIEFVDNKFCNKSSLLLRSCRNGLELDKINLKKEKAWNF